MEGTQPFKTLLSTRIGPWLKDRGFVPKGHRFVKWVGRNCQVIGFRRAKWSALQGYEFLVDLGIFSERIWNFYVRLERSGRLKPPWNSVLPTTSMPKFPLPEDCRWGTSIQEPLLVPAYFNRPWSIRDVSEIPRLADEVETVLATHAIPALNKYVSDEALRDLWLESGKFARSNVQHLTFLAVLLSEIGPRAELPAVLEKLRNLSRETPSLEAKLAELEAANK